MNLGPSEGCGQTHLFNYNSHNRLKSPDRSYYPATALCLSDTDLIKFSIELFQLLKVTILTNMLTLFV